MIYDTPLRAAAFMARTSFRACASFALIHLLANPAAAQSIAGASVSAGSATVSGVGSTNVTIAQTSDKAVIDWRAFSVDAGTTVTFRQPGTTSIALNRITGSGATTIDGSLVANGQVWLLNPNGVLIGAGGSVAAGGFLASTHAISNADFMAGNYQLTGDGSGAGVTNLGSIVAADGGYAVLAGNAVANAGLVQARLGQVVLGAGKTFVLDVVGDKLLSFAVTEPLSIVAGSGALVDNTGILAAQGGQVLLTARAAAGVVGSVINTSGLIDATAVSSQGGTIVLDGGDTGLVYAAGTLDASGKATGQTGGTIGVFGDTVVAGAGALLDASGDAGGGVINIGGGWQGAIVGNHASAVRSGLAASATLDASALSDGNGGTVTLWSDVTNAASQTIAYGTILARGGVNGGNGGRIETSGHFLDTTGVRGSAAAALGTAGLWLFDPYNVEIVASTGNSPDIVNPGFENGLTGWTVIGSGGSADVVTSAQANSGTVYTSQVSANGNFLLATGGTVNSGNGVTQTFTASAGQTFNLYALFLGKDNASYNDNGIVTLKQPDGTTLTLYSQSISTVGAYGTAPWQNQLVTLTQTGTYTITATSANIGDSAAPSQLGFELAASNASVNGAFAGNTALQTWTPTATASKIDVSQITGFLNAGTNVQITTTGAGTEAGNITVNAAIAKTAGTAATLQLDAVGAIIVNQAISSASNALNVTLNAGGGIALGATVATNGGTLTLNTTGTTTQTAAFATTGLVLNGAGGNYALTDGGNSFQTLSGSTGTVSIANMAAATNLGALATSGDFAIATSGAVTQSGALSASKVTLNGTGIYTLTNAGNAFATLGGSTGSASVFDTSATSVVSLTTTGTFTLSSGGAIGVSGTDSFGGDATLTTASGITLAAGTQITTAGTLALEGGTFVNNAGAGAVATSGTGRWLIYSQTPANDTFGNSTIGYLTSGNLAIWGQTATSTPPSSAASGNRYIFSTSPTITVTPTATHKTYGDTLTAAGVPYTATGLVNAATYGNVFTQDVLTGAAGVDGSYGGFAPTSFTGAYQLHSTQGTLATTAGYTFTFGQSTLTVDPRTLILTATTANKVYDGAATTTAAPTATGLANADTVTNLSESYDSRNAGTRTLAVNAGYTVNDGNNGNNYTVSLQTATGTITAKALTASLVGSVAKTYDGTLAATLASGNYTLTGGVVGTDNVALNDPTSGSYDTKNVGTGKAVSVAGLALTGSDASNYTVNVSASANIGNIMAKALTASLTGSVSKTYDGSTTATLADGNYVLSGAVQNDNVALNDPTAGTYDTKNAGTGKAVSVAGLALTGSDAGNYTVNASASANIGSITAKALTASLTGSVSKTYDGSTTATLADGNYVLSGAVQNDNVALNDPTAGTYDTKNVGSSKAVSVAGLGLTGSDAGNYTVNATASANIGNITAKALTAGLTGSVSKTYDGSTTATLADGNYVLSGAVQNDNVALNDLTAGTYDTKNAGTGKTVAVTGLALTGSDAGNYTVNAGTSAAIGSIAAKALTASLTGSVSKTYDGSTAATLAAGNYVLSGAVSGDAVALNDPTAGTYDTKNVGSAKTVAVTGLDLTGADAANYTVNAGTSAAIGSIAAKALTASLAGSVAKTYDGTTAATLANGNYVLTGAVSGDAVALNDPTAGTYDTKNAGTGKSVAVTGLALTGADAGNYTVNASASAAIGSVAAKALAASLTGSVSKTYDGSTSAALANGNYVLTGAVSGDAVALNDPTVGTYDTKNAGTGKTVVVTGLALTGADAGNYTVNTGASAAIGTVAAKALAVSLVGTVAKTANGGTDAALTPDNFLLAGFVSGEGATVGKTSGNYANASAGTGIVVTTTLAASDFAPAAGTALSNYVLPVGTVSGPVGTINPSIVIVTPIPAAAVVAAIAATAVLPATSVPVPVTPVADADTTTTVAAASAGAITVAVNVDRSPPSPVAAQKPPTPVDSADAGDPILATVSEPPSEKPASHATRQATVTVPIAGGLLAQQQTVPSRSNTVPGVDQAFSGGGGVF